MPFPMPDILTSFAKPNYTPARTPSPSVAAAVAYFTENQTAGCDLMPSPLIVASPFSYDFGPMPSQADVDSLQLALPADVLPNNFESLWAEWLEPQAVQ